MGALRFEQRRPKTTNLQSAPDTITGLNTHNTLPYGFRRRRKANEECVVKHTIVGFAPTYRAVNAGSYVQCTQLDHTVCFTTLPFYTSTLPP